MAAYTLLERHRQRPLHCLGDTLDVVRVDMQCLRQLLSGASESGKNEYARIARILGGEELLGDKVHAIA